MCNRIRYKLTIKYTESPFKQEIRTYCFDLSKASGIEDLYEFLSMFRVKPFRKILDVELYAEGGHEEL